MPEETQQTPPRRQPSARGGGTGNSLGIPIAIVIAAVLIAGSIYLTRSEPAPATTATGNNSGPEERITPEATPVGELDEIDHVRGNPEAPIVLVEYSDFDCPFCKSFHTTVKGIATGNYGINGDVAWAYRHFPIQQLHPNAPAIAHISECVAEDAGSDAFWAFADGYFDGDVSDEASLYALVNEVGADETAVRACMNENRYVDRIQADLLEAADAGGNGTPFTVFLFKEPMTDELRTLVAQLGTQYRGRDGRSLFTTLSDTQLSMSGALDASVVTSIIEAQLGIAGE